MWKAPIQGRQRISHTLPTRRGPPSHVTCTTLSLSLSVVVVSQNERAGWWGGSEEQVKRIQFYWILPHSQPRDSHIRQSLSQSLSQSVSSQRPDPT